MSEAEFKGWSKPQQMAFLINAYNGYTLELILQNYPVKSIKDIGGVFDNRWKRKFFKLLGTRFVPRPDRARNAAQARRVQRAARAFRGELRVDRLPDAARGSVRRRHGSTAQLEEQAVRFLSDRSRNRYANGKLEVSMIFNWFKEDWASGYRGFDGKDDRRFKSREDYFARYANCSPTSPTDQKMIADQGGADYASRLRLESERREAMIGLSIIIPTLDEASGIRGWRSNDFSRFAPLGTKSSSSMAVAVTERAHSAEPLADRVLAELSVDARAK